MSNTAGCDAELWPEIVIECGEHLSAIEQELLSLELDPGNVEPLHDLFRAFHNIKGLAGFLELPAIQELAHEVETILDLVRGSQARITPALIDCLLQSRDTLAGWIGHLQNSPGDTAGILAKPDAALLQRLRAFALTPTAVPGGDDLSRHLSSKPSEESASIRVDSAKIDLLVDTVGQLVLAQSQDLRLPANLARLARLTAEVQRSALAMRMVPVGRVFQKMSRIVRDLAKRSHKQVELALAGENTELDRVIVQELADPLMHMVRNALDHGIESPAERALAGKPPGATLSLRARHQGGLILIEVSDDGRGLDARRIEAKARKTGLIGPDAHLDEQEAYQLIFQPGFSTADQVTDISGRGVGMDVVRKHIQKLRGRIEIQSQPGRGTTFLLKLPLTLAIIDGLIAGVGKERYVAPVHAVRQMLRPTPDMLSMTQDKGEMVRIRGSLLPLVRLHERFGVEPRSHHPCDGVVVLAEAAGGRFALLVDELYGKQELVIKSLDPFLPSVPGIAGASILGDGQVALILDFDSLGACQAA